MDTTTPPPTEQRVRIGPIMRDVVIVYAAGWMGGFVADIATGGPSRDAQRFIALVISRYLLGTVAFTIAGCLAPPSRWRHLGFVAVGAWFASLINVVFLGVSIPQWIGGAIFMAIIMGLGGAISYVFKRGTKPLGSYRNKDEARNNDPEKSTVYDTQLSGFHLKPDMSDKFFQIDSTYYSYSEPRPFFSFKRLLGLKPWWSPYCPTCRKWVHIYERMLGIAVSENVLSELHEADIVKRLLGRDWSVLKAVARPPNWTIRQPIIFIALGRCDTCDGPFEVLGEVRGQTGKRLVVGGLFSMEIAKESALELLETAIERNLPSNDKMYAKAVDFCKHLGSSKDFAQVASVK